MSEIKHNFTGGKMNKDLDERLVKNGEYRHAMNVQVRNTDGDASGTVQNIQGNTSVGTAFLQNVVEINSTLPTCIGSVADEKSNKGYFFFAGDFMPKNPDPICGVVQEALYIDSIIEQDARGESTPVVVDKYGVIQSTETAIPSNINWSVTTLGTFSELEVVDGSKYRVGMTVQAYNSNDTTINDYFSQSYVDVDNNTTQSEPPIIHAIQINQDGNDVLLFREPVLGVTTDLSNATHWVFKHKRVLNFEINSIKYITGINVIDNLLFWTDNYNEPKKINIDRCKDGTDDLSTHTKLFVKSPQSLNTLVDISEIDDNLNTAPTNSDITEEHITVIRKSPNTPPSIDMKSEDRVGVTDIEVEDCPLVNDDYNVSLEIGENVILTNDAFEDSKFMQGDIVIFTEQYNNDVDVDVNDPIIVKFNFIGYLDSNDNIVSESTDKIQIKALSLAFSSDTLSVSKDNWSISIEKRKPLFELKLVRFGYRYKYEDGEYSSFSPWSRVAFLPDEFDYETKKAYNLGMVNTVRQLTIKDFIPYNRPKDVCEIDILYKSSDSPTVYVASTVKRGVDAEWELFTPDPNSIINENNQLTASGEIRQGQLTITSEMVHQVLPESQLLRGWDNVPKRALAQEIIGNRLLFGNYYQGYDIMPAVNLTQSVVSNDSPSVSNPKPSVKSIRDYKIGMVFGDKYGRQTPVISSSYFLDAGDDDYESFSGDVSVDKILCAQQNSFLLQQSWGNLDLAGNPPDWMLDGGYVKYYVKETSNEYYNLVMDRFYDSGDGTLWLAFNSADRNKVDEETYLLLKNRQDNNEAVLEKARYKIISIKNEAPEYIKTKRLSLGKIQIDDTNTEAIWIGGTPAAVAPNGFWGSDLSIFIDGTSWNDSPIGSNSPASATIFGRELKGKVEMQVVGTLNTLETKYSDWRELSHFSQQDIDNGAAQKISLNWTTPYTTVINGGADMFNYFNCGDPAVDCTNIVYELKFREAVIENKPEFDGKFFVKIEKDLTVVNTLETSISNLSVDGEFNIDYIESTVSNQSLQPMMNSLPATATFDNTDSDADNWFQGAFEGIVNLSDGSTLPDSFFEDVEFHIDNGGSPSGPHEYGTSFPGGCTTGSFFSDVYTNTTAVECPDRNMFLGFCLASGGTYGTNGNTPQDGNRAAAALLYNPMIDEFWTSYSSNSDGLGVKSGIFIDGAAAPKIHQNSVFNDDDDFYAQENDSGGPTQAATKPISLQKGSFFFNGESGASGDTMGQLQISKTTGQMFNLLNSWSFPAGTTPTIDINLTATQARDLLYEKLKTVNTIFSFAQDPNNHKYRVVWASPTDENVKGTRAFTYNYLQGPTNTIQTCYNPTASAVNGETNDYAQNLAGRHTTSIEVRRIDTATGLTTSLGFPVAGSETGVTNFDPRSLMKHDGSTSTKIIVYNTTSNLDGLFEETSSELGACWETEPKEDVDVDIYYEASHAIPMRLNESNAADFSPIGSEISISRPFEQGIAEVTLGPVSTFGESVIASTNHRVGNIFFLNDKVIISIIYSHPIFSAFSYAPYGLLKQDITVGDNITFRHNDGTLTQSKIKGFYRPIDSDIFGPDQLITDEENIKGIFNNPRAFQKNITGGDFNVIFSSSLAGWEDGDSTELLILASEIEDPQSLVNMQVGSAFQSVGEYNVNFEPTNTTILAVALWPTNNDYYVISLSNLDSISTTNTTYYTEANLFCCPETFSYNASGVPNAILIPNNELETGIEGFQVGLISASGYYEIDKDVWKYPVQLGWHNCWSFGNGVESDRIRDDYNAPQLNNGVIASTTLTGYGEENISSGMIYSGLYNSTSQVNDLNEFNMSEKITKELNPRYGSIQRLKTRDTDTVVLTEDKTFRLLANKDALYNADGNAQLTASDRVLGTAMPYAGDYGISKNPESLAWDQYRMYFTDKQRGAVLRLSKDGLTPISNVGMKSYFIKSLSNDDVDSAIGSFDTVGGDYNLTLKYRQNMGDDTTISFNEVSKGWVSFKSFIQDSGLSVSGVYLTSKKGEIWKHYANDYANYVSETDNTCDEAPCVERNKFYNNNIITPSSMRLLFNDAPGSVKSFKAINYEGSQARIIMHQDYLGTNPSLTTITDAAGNTVSNLSDGEYYNFNNKEGWWVYNMKTDLEEGEVLEFKKKEGKWFNKISGIGNTDVTSLNTSDFTVQGIGQYSTMTGDYSGVITDGDGFTSLTTGCMDDGLLTDSPYPGYAALNVGLFDINDFSLCEYDTIGCTDPLATNYNANAVVPDGACLYEEGTTDDDNGVIFGAGYCCDENAVNYTSWAAGTNCCSNNSCCIYQDDDGNNYVITDDDEEVVVQIGGCADTTVGDNADIEGQYSNTAQTAEGVNGYLAYNFNPNATFDDGSCYYEIFGCTNPDAPNYNPSATVDNGSCFDVFGEDPSIIEFFVQNWQDDSEAEVDNPDFI